MGYGTTLYRHKVTVEPFTGEGGVGPTFGDPYKMRCRIRLERKVIRTTEGDEVVADATLICDPGENIPIQSRVTYSDRVYRVSEIVPGHGPHTAVNHLEVRLTAD